MPLKLTKASTVLYSNHQRNHPQLKQEKNLFKTFDGLLLYRMLRRFQHVTCADKNKVKPAVEKSEKARLQRRAGDARTTICVAIWNVSSVGGSEARGTPANTH